MIRRIDTRTRMAAGRGTGLAIACLLGLSGIGVCPAAAADAPAAERARSAAGNDGAPAPANDLSYSRESYYYSATGLRDPFGSLVSGRFVSEETKRLPDVGSIELLGVIWGENDKFALAEDKDKHGFVLRVGDPVVNGEVAGITRESLTIRQHFFGTSTTITLKLKPREDNGHARKNKR